MPSKTTLTMIIQILKNYKNTDLLRQTPGRSGFWNDIQFIVDETKPCDGTIVLNYPPESYTIQCPKENIWAILQEPYLPQTFKWMSTGHEKYSRVFTHHPPNTDPKYIESQPATPWHVNRSFDELSSQKPDISKQQLSWIMSNYQNFPGHIKRMNFFKYMMSQRTFNADVYGKGVNFIEDKWDGLAPYRYSLAIENSSTPNYWTEKLADCFLSWCVPIYYGCTNIDSYFPKNSFIQIDIEKPNDALRKINRTISKRDWESRLPALKKARELVLNEYQLFPKVARIAKQHGNKGKIVKTKLKRHKTYTTLIKRALEKMRKYRRSQNLLTL